MQTRQSGCRQPSTVHRLLLPLVSHSNWFNANYIPWWNIYAPTKQKPITKMNLTRNGELRLRKREEKISRERNQYLIFSVFFSRFLFVRVCVAWPENKTCVKNTKAVMKCEKVRTECNLWNSFCQFTNIVRLVCDSCAPEKRTEIWIIFFCVSFSCERCIECIEFCSLKHTLKFKFSNRSHGMHRLPAPTMYKIVCDKVMSLKMTKMSNPTSNHRI